MPDLFNFSAEMQDYFDTLSPMVQESIIQSGAKLNSMADMKAVATQMSQSTNNQSYNQ